MKTNYLFLGLATLALLFTSCEADDTADVNITNTDNSVTNNNNGPDNPQPEPEPGMSTTIGGTLSENLTLEANTTYTLESALIVPDGITLTMNPGTVVRANTGSGVFIAISQGARILAEGTSSNPIILTSNVSTPNAGDWGGLIVLGRAPVNSASTGGTSTSEIGQLPYGGATPADNSGIISYVRVEYSGGAASASEENNGFSFYGVGSGTRVDHIQAFEGADDGIEFFGGTVNASFVSSVGSQDDSVDWTEGYSGNLTDVYIEHGVSHDKGVEADGFNPDFGNNGGFLSNVTITNLTIIGRGTTASGSDNEAIRLRVGTRATMNNVLLRGFDEGYDLDDAETGNGVVMDLSNIVNITFDQVTRPLKNDTGAMFASEDFISGVGNGTGTDYATWSQGWTRR